MPGDITISKLTSGYRVSRVLPQLGPGPWWEYIAVVTGFEEATQLAHQTAREYRAKVWLNESGDQYQRLTEMIAPLTDADPKSN